MVQTSLRAAIVALTFVAGAHAGITDTDPGLYTDFEELLEARVRLDGGNSQTWKSAFWRDATMLSNSGVRQNIFANQTQYDFLMRYEALTGFATLEVSQFGVLALTETYALSPDQSLAGFQIYARSESNGSTTQLTNLAVSTDGSLPDSLPDLTSGPSATWITRQHYVDSATETIEVTGNFLFDWVSGTNLNNERFKFGIKWQQGSPVPAPSILTLLGGAGLAMASRRRR